MFYSKKITQDEILSMTSIDDIATFADYDNTRDFLKKSELFERKFTFQEHFTSNDLLKIVVVGGTTIAYASDFEAPRLAFTQGTTNLDNGYCKVVKSIPKTKCASISVLVHDWSVGAGSGRNFTLGFSNAGARIGSDNYCAFKYASGDWSVHSFANQEGSVEEIFTCNMGDLLTVLLERRNKTATKWDTVSFYQNNNLIKEVTASEAIPDVALFPFVSCDCGNGCTVSPFFTVSYIDVKDWW